MLLFSVRALLSAFWVLVELAVAFAVVVGAVAVAAAVAGARGVAALVPVAPMNFVFRGRRGVQVAVALSMSFACKLVALSSSSVASFCLRNAPWPSWVFPCFPVSCVLGQPVRPEGFFSVGGVQYYASCRWFPALALRLLCALLFRIAPSASRRRSLVLFLVRHLFLSLPLPSPLPLTLLLLRLLQTKKKNNEGKKIFSSAAARLMARRLRILFLGIPRLLCLVPGGLNFGQAEIIGRTSRFLSRFRVFFLLRAVAAQLPPGRFDVPCAPPVAGPVNAKQATNFGSNTDPD